MYSGEVWGLLIDHQGHFNANADCRWFIILILMLSLRLMSLHPLCPLPSTCIHVFLKIFHQRKLGRRKILDRDNHLMVKWLKRWLIALGHLLSHWCSSWPNKMSHFCNKLGVKFQRMAFSENWGHFPSVETFISILMCPHPFYLFLHTCKIWEFSKMWS